MDDDDQKMKVEVVKIDIPDGVEMDMGDVIAELRKGIDYIMANSNSPQSYWRSFSKHYGLDKGDLGTLAHRFSAYTFFCGMHSMYEICMDLGKIKEPKMQKAGFLFIKGLIAGEMEKYRIVTEKDDEKSD